MWTSPPRVALPQSITDEFAYVPLDDDPFRWPHCDFEHRIALPLHIHSRWILPNENLFVVGVNVVSPDGRVKFQPNLERHESVDNLWAPIQASDQGNRLAVHVRTLRGGNRALDIGSHVTARRIAVYDVEAAKEIASIPASIKYRYCVAFDLSPDLTFDVTIARKADWGAVTIPRTSYEFPARCPDCSRTGSLTAVPISAKLRIKVPFCELCARKLGTNGTFTNFYSPKDCRTLRPISPSVLPSRTPHLSGTTTSGSFHIFR